MEKKRFGFGLAVVALGSYIIGGIQTFAGIVLFFFFNDRSIGSWGKGHSIGLLFLCVGLALCLGGVLLMRLCQNRALK